MCQIAIMRQRLVRTALSPLSRPNNFIKTSAPKASSYLQANRFSSSTSHVPSPQFSNSASSIWQSLAAILRDSSLFLRRFLKKSIHSMKVASAASFSSRSAQILFTNAAAGICIHHIIFQRRFTMAHCDGAAPSTDFNRSPSPSPIQVPSTSVSSSSPSVSATPSLLRQLAAHLLDSAIITAAMSLLPPLLQFIDPLVSSVIITVIPFLYDVYFCLYHGVPTPGQAALGLRLAPETSKRLRFRHVAVRRLVHMGQVTSMHDPKLNAVRLVDFACALLTGRFLHDMLAGTVVEFDDDE